MLKAVPSPSPPVAALAAEPGWRLSGLRLADGTVMLKVEHGVAAVQLRVSDGTGFEGKVTDMMRTDSKGIRIAEELVGGARREGRKFLRYHYDNPDIEGDEETGSGS